MVGPKPENFESEEYGINLWQSLITISAAKVYLYEVDLLQNCTVFSNIFIIINKFYLFQTIAKFLTMKQSEAIAEIKNKNKNQFFTNILIYVYSIVKLSRYYPTWKFRYLYRSKNIVVLKSMYHISLVLKNFLGYLLLLLFSREFCKNFQNKSGSAHYSFSKATKMNITIALDN